MPRFHNDLPRDDDTCKPLHDKIMYWVDANVTGILKKVFPDPDPRQDFTKPIMTEWQLVVRQDYLARGPIIGVVDMAVRLCGLYEGQPCFPGPYVHYAVIVKTEIRSLGELLREIQICRTGNIYNRGNADLKDTPFIVVSPDDRHAAKLKEQKVFFFKYDPDYKFEA